MSTYTAYTVASRTAKVIHLWVGTGNLCPSAAENIATLQQVSDSKVCVKCAKRQDEFETAQAAGQAAAARIAETERARRLSRGQSAVTGWELLYDKPRQGCQVGRRDKEYALICTTHRFVRPVAKLVQERELRKVGGWCAHCDH